MELIKIQSKQNLPGSTAQTIFINPQFIEMINENNQGKVTIHLNSNKDIDVDGPLTNVISALKGYIKE